MRRTRLYHLYSVLLAAILIGVVPRTINAESAPLEVLLFASVTSAAPGQSVSYSIVLNPDSDAPLPATLTASFDDGLLLQQADGLQGQRCEIDGQRVRCNLLLSEDGATISVQTQVQPTAASGATLRASASVETSDGTIVNADPVVVTVQGEAEPTATAPLPTATEPAVTPTEPPATATAPAPLPTTSRVPTATATPARASATTRAATPQAEPAHKGPTPDVLENNWSPTTAAPIGVGVDYDLNFICPITDGCPGGDFDYLRVTVKAGVQYLLATYDLGPGVDTVLDLYWGDEATPVASNDDARSGYSFLSALRWTAPSDGEALIRIGPRTGGLKPIVAEGQGAPYRFAIDLAASPEGKALAQRIAEQTFEPTPTPSRVPNRPPSPPVVAPPVPQMPASPGPPSPSSPRPAATVVTTNTVQQVISKGVATVVVSNTVLRLQPSSASPLITTLTQETLVSLLGEARGLWVRVSTVDDVLPGWVVATDLQRVTAQLPTPAAPVATALLTATTALPPGAIAPTAEATPPTVTRIEPLPPPAAAPPPTRITRSVAVQILTAAIGARRTTSGRTPTPSAEAGIAGVRVQLVNAFDDVLVEGITDAHGSVTLSRDVLPGTALRVRLPALGLEHDIDKDSSATPQLVRVVLPEGATR